MLGILEKIIEILSTLFLRTSEQRYERRAKENLVFLHQCILECHLAYSDYKADPDESSFDRWRWRVRELRDALVDVQLVLASLSPHTYDLAVVYVERESGSPPPIQLRGSEPDEVEQVGLLYRKLKRLSGSDTRTAEAAIVGFEEASRELRKVIAQHLTPGEIQRAFEDFERGMRRKPPRDFHPPRRIRRQFGPSFPSTQD